LGWMDKSASSAGLARVYRLKWWRKALALFFLIFGLLGANAFWAGPVFGPKHPEVWGMVATAGITLSGVFLTADAFTQTIVLWHDAIEKRTLFVTQRLEFAKIRGRREYDEEGYDSNTRYLELEPNDRRLPTLKFEKYFTFDREFYAWFNSFPDLGRKN